MDASDLMGQVQSPGFSSPPRGRLLRVARTEQLRLDTRQDQPLPPVICARYARVAMSRKSGKVEMQARQGKPRGIGSNEKRAMPSIRESKTHTSNRECWRGEKKKKKNWARHRCGGVQACSLEEFLKGEANSLCPHPGQGSVKSAGCLGGRATWVLIMAVDGPDFVTVHGCHIGGEQGSHLSPGSVRTGADVDL